MTDEKPVLLLSAMLDKNYKIVLKFYDPNTGSAVIKKGTEYDEYCYADRNYDKLGEIDDDKQTFVTKIDPVTDEEIHLTKAVTHGYTFARHRVDTDETDALGRPILSKETSPLVWESDVKQHESYLHDNDLTVGMHYDVTGKPRQIEMPVPENVETELKKILESKESGQFKEHLSDWANTLSQPIPHIRRTAMDIEIDTERGRSIEDLVDSGDRTITAISFKGDGIDRVLAFGNENDKLLQSAQPDGFDLVIYTNETKMLVDAFKTMEEYPVILTYNGMSFDLPYMESRARTLDKSGSNIMSDIPFYTRKNNMGQATHNVTFRKCVHVDLYNIMDNKAFQIYVFGNKYSKKGLDDVSKAILGRGKLEHDVFDSSQSVAQLAKYCYHDSLLTYDLTAHENDMLMNMLVIISRISRMPLDDVARYRISQWIRSRFYYNHRKNNFLIPNRSDLKKRSIGMKNDAITDGKKYQGGAVMQPDSGIYFDVVVVDFASLYPSIVKSYNISYETVRCPHEECRTANPLEGTNHWCCEKKYGMTSLIIGSLRDLRVQYYKRLSKDESIPEDLREQYDTVAQALKVILNAAYGVLGADKFPLYFPPAAEAVTAIGRTIINGSIEICKNNDVKVLYGDSVLGDTPIVCERNGVRQIVPIESLITHTTTSGRQKHATLKVLSDNGLVDVKYSYIHKVRKQGYRIGTRKAYVEVTDDHSLVVGGKEIKPHQLMIGDHIDTSEQHVFGNDCVLSNDIAWLFGFYLSDGTLGTYGLKRAWKIVKNDRTKLEKAQKIMSECLGFDTAIHNYSSEDKLHTLTPANRSLSAVTEYFRLHCYSNTIKVVPPCILNGTMQVKKAFVQGLIDGDGHVDKKDVSVTFGQIHKSILAGYISVITALGHDYSLKFRKDKPNFISIRIIKNTDDVRIRKADTVTLLERFEIDTYVYDLSTHNEHFRGGLGNVLLHNTDSVFLLSPSEEQIDSIISQARGKYKVDLEVDKTYDYCVFSDRKKNYYGKLDSGKMDIKGLAGKKSNTPQFARELFTDIMDVLQTIKCEDDIDPITDRITEMIGKCINDVRDGNVPLESMVFTNLLGEDLKKHTVKLKQDDIESVISEVDEIIRVCIDDMKNQNRPLEHGTFVELLGEKWNGSTDRLKQNSFGTLAHGAIEIISEYINGVKKGNITTELAVSTAVSDAELKKYADTFRQEIIQYCLPKKKTDRHKLKNSFNPDATKCPTDMQAYGRLPLHVKSALWMCRNDMSENNSDENKKSNLAKKAERMLSSLELGKGDAVSYIKMTDPVKALPFEMFGKNDNTSMEWNMPEKFNAELKPYDDSFGKHACRVDVDKYISLLTATLEPILEPLGVEFQAKKSAVKTAGKTAKKTASASTNLDVFF